jgi:hypothetical protein
LFRPAKVDAEDICRFAFGVTHKLREQARAYELKGQWADTEDACREILE